MSAQHNEIQILDERMGRLEGLMSKMVDAMSRIALLDERQGVVATALQRVDERLARVEARQQEADIARAMSQTSNERLASIESAVREMHIERERDLARFQTVIWLIRGLWATVTAGGLTVAAKIWGM
jgi:hypothetical protein